MEGLLPSGIRRNPYWGWGGGAARRGRNSKGSGGKDKKGGGMRKGESEQRVCKPMEKNRRQRRTDPEFASET